MKITIATGPTFPVPAVRGGAVQRMWYGLAKEFAKRGHEVTIFARDFPGQAKDERVGGVRYVRWGGYNQSTSINRDLLRCFLYAVRAARRMPAGDIVVTNDFWMPAILPRLYPSAGKVVVNANRYPKGQYRLYGKAAAFAAASQAVAKAIADQSPRYADKIVVLPNAVDGAFFDTPSTRKAPADEKPSTRPLRILFAGRVHPEKGIELLMKALPALGGLTEMVTEGPMGKLEKQWECVLMGPVAEDQGGGGDDFARRMKELAGAAPVQFAPPIFDPSALAASYDEADALVYPSVAETGESFGLAPLEAMARGMAPVVSDLGVFREYLEPGVNGVVFDHRSEHAASNLAAALAELIDYPSKRLRMAEAARATATLFSPAVVAEKYLNLFERVAGNARAVFHD